MSIPFLQEIAKHFAEVHGDQLYNYRFFFPNRRSGVFFEHYLRVALGNRVAILPEVTTMGEYLRRVLFLPEEDVNNDLFVTYELCRVYNEIADEEQERTFNDFTYLGKLILGDFNDIDKHLLPVDQIFRNVADYEELNDDFSYLSHEQIDALKHFFGYEGFLKEPKRYQQKFMKFWELLPELYHKTKERLSAVGLRYEGMLLRDVVERIQAGELSLVGDGRISVFVGLNALTPCEMKIFSHFQSSGAIFYWDYLSDLLASPTLSGAFQSNMKQYPMPEEGSPDYIHFSEAAKPEEQEVELVALPSEVAQTVYIGDYLRDEVAPEDIEAMKVAVVLPSERLLIPLLSNIPSTIPNLNVTMGYPVRELPTVAMLLRLLELRLIVRHRGHEWRGEEIREILGMNPLNGIMGQGHFGMRCADRIVQERWFFITAEEFVLQIVRQAEPTEEQKALISILFREGVESGEALLRWCVDLIALLAKCVVVTEEDEETRVYSGEKSVLPFLSDLFTKQAESLEHYADEHGAEVHALFAYEVMHDLLTTLLRQSRIPYKGEPLRGLQVMGILETRGLDFETIIIPDAAEDLLPTKTRLIGVIPYPIRQGLGLPTYKWQDQTRAYNFFRLISRARRIITTYDTRRGDHSGGEPSRYMRLLEYVYGRRVHRILAHFPVRVEQREPEDFPIDSGLVRDFVKGITEGTEPLSASKINQYIECPRSFYYKTILGLEERKELDELISDSDMGTLVHNTLQHIYMPFEGRKVDKAQLKAYVEELDTEVTGAKGIIRSTLEEEYTKLFHRKSGGVTGMNDIVIQRAVIYVCNVLRLDIQNPDQIYYVGGEVKFTLQSPVAGDSMTTVNLKGFIDRIDYVEREGQISQLRVIDYKTGRDSIEVNMEDFGSDKKNFNHAAFQVFLYAHYLSDSAFSGALSDREVGGVTKTYRNYLPDKYKLTPMIIKPQLSNDGYLMLGGDQPIEDFETIAEEFAHILYTALGEIADPFNSYPTKSRNSSCLYCPARSFCINAH